MMGGKRWTESRIRDISGTVSSRTELSRVHRGAYRVACNIPGLLDELYGNNKFVWSRDDIVLEASKYKTKDEFRRSSGGCYGACLTKFPGLIDDLFNNQINYWKDEQTVLNEALKYSKRSDFKKNSSGAYKAAIAKFPDVLVVAFREPLVKKWKLCDLEVEASKYSSRDDFRKANCGAYAAFSNFPGALDKIFPSKYRRWKNECDIRAEASKYRTKAEFVYGCVSAYGAALQLGIIDDLGFEPAGPGFDTTEPAYLYITSIRLKSGIDGVMFGVTNRALRGRYTALERKHMFDLTAYLFDKGSSALEIETLLRREFGSFAVQEGESPLVAKKGTAGEILRDISIEAVRSRASAYCSHLQVINDWAVTE